MYAAIVFAALIGSVVGSRAASLSDGREFGHSKSVFAFQVVADIELQKVVTGAVSAIDKIAKAPWKAEQKLMAIQQTVEKVSVYRAKSWSKSPFTEQKLDLLIGPYESFPAANNFNKRNCRDYQSTLKVDWEPATPGVPKLHGVRRAWDNLKAICES